MNSWCHEIGSRVGCDCHQGHILATAGLRALTGPRRGHPAQRRRRLGSVIVSLLLGVTLSTSARADDFHSHDFRFGQRAMAMGGAVVGAVTGPTASFYNPAGLGFLYGSLFSGALQYYGWDRRTVKDALRADPIGTKTLTSGSFLATPTSSVLSHGFAGGRHRIAYSTFLVTDVDEHFSGSLSDTFDTASYSNQEVVRASWRSRDKVLFIGPSYAYRATPTLSLGISIFYARRDQTLDHSSDVQTDQYDVATDLFYRSLFDDHGTSVTLHDGALLARIGLMWVPSKRFSLGLTVRTRSISLHGSGTEHFRYTTSGDANLTPPVSPDRFSFSEKMMDVTTVYPWSFSTGVGFRPIPTLHIMVSGDLDLAVQYNRFEVDAFTTPSRSSLHRVDRRLNWNVSAGVEWLLTQRIPLRFGLFTNRSAAPAVPVQHLSRSAPQVHLYGVTGSAGYLGDKRSFNVGVEFTRGRGYDSVAAESAMYDADYVRASREESRLILFLSGAIAFAKDKAKRIIKEKWLNKPASQSSTPPTPSKSTPSKPGRSTP